MAIIDLIRHAEPDVTVHDDMLRPLTQTGRQQAQRLASKLRNVPIPPSFQALISAPLIRSRLLLVTTVFSFTRSTN